MLIYWLLFSYFAVGALMNVFSKSATSKLFLGLGAVVTALLIGLRYHVGGDWYEYQFMFELTGRISYARALTLSEWGYQTLNWGVQQLGWRLFVVNLVSGAFFSWGLYKFCSTQEEPWLAAVAAVPYMIIVVAMGYTRQAVALGILMTGLANFIRTGSTTRFALYSALAACFHRSAVVVFPVAALSRPRNRLVNVLLVPVCFYILYHMFLENSVDLYVRNYVDAQYSSQGAAIRIAMSLVAGLVFWTFRRRFAFPPAEHALWRNFSIAAVAMVILLYVSPSSTAVDRMSLYILPLQLAVASRVPRLLGSRMFGRTLVIALFALVQFVWLTYGQFSSHWVPYQFYPI